MDKTYSVCILTNPVNTVFYIGMTNDLQRRIAEHKAKAVQGFTRRYNIVKLIYAESFSNPLEAITAEKRIKKWPLTKKFKLISENNPHFRDLA